MKKNLCLALMACAMPLLISSCNGSVGSIGDTKETYTLKDTDYLCIIYGNNYDTYTTKQFHNKIYTDSIGNGDYWFYGEFTIKVTYWELGADVKISGLTDTETKFTYRGEFTFQLISYK